MQVLVFSPAMADIAWPHLLPLVTRALAEGDGEYEPADVLDLLKRGAWVAFATREDGVLTNMAACEVLAYPRKRVLFVHLGAGRDALGTVKAMWPTIKEYAQAHDCTLVRLFGRRGWARVLTRTGTGAGTRIKEALSLEVSP